MGSQDVAFLPSRASFSIVFAKICGRGEILGTTTCLRTVVGSSKGIFPVKLWLGQARACSL